MKIADRTFIISGGASGLGLATAKDLHSHGAYVSILDMDADAGEALIKELGSRAAFFTTDVSETENHRQAQRAPPLSSIDFVLNINLRGTLDLIRQALPHMTKVTPLEPDNERGILLLVSSSAAFDGQPGQVAYAASKGAIASLTLPLARDLARYGIRAVTIAPSLFESKMTSMLGEKAKKSLERVMEFPVRAGRPEEFARLVREAVENVMLNGTVIRLDGAMRMPSKM
ncbi:hypothetical protein H2199_002463 [Coniosporium tulheliwenetii]|uniref:Uncharacterized protein n=1 Tax=Coniosporium tulheliwenetii TaxID=3383036 RepID=A0ACC2ZF60_9PEZI|nr:hypothetical protein H2199_002463 [Cladosporium sp. JES 115]